MHGTQQGGHSSMGLWRGHGPPAGPNRTAVGGLAGEADPDACGAKGIVITITITGHGGAAPSSQGGPLISKLAQPGAIVLYTGHDGLAVLSQGGPLIAIVIYTGHDGTLNYRLRTEGNWAGGECVA